MGRISYTMKKFNAGLLWSFILLCGTARLQAQTIVPGTTNTWFLLLNQLRFGKHWGWSNEIHERTGKFLHVQGQFLLRPSVDYHLNKSAVFSLGYSYIHLWPYAPYGNPPLSRAEHNVWEQVLLRQELGRVRFLHRFRQEHRWVPRMDTTSGGDWRVSGRSYANRFRYRFTVWIDLWSDAQGRRSLFLALFDEFWFNQSHNLLPSNFARNWLFAGLGYRFDPTTNLQIGFMHQYDRIDDHRYISTPIVQMVLGKDLIFAGDKKKRGQS